MPATTVTLDDEGVARLAQVIFGLSAVSTLPAADIYTDAEGTPIATRAGDVITPIRTPRWPNPYDVKTSAPVFVAIAEQVPVGATATTDAVLLLPTGGVRVDEARFHEWAQAWRAVAADVVEVPVTAGEAAQRAAELAASYSSGPVVEIATVPMPAGSGRVIFFTGLSGSGKSTIARGVVERLVGTRRVTLLDGDVVRTHLSKGLGFGREDRDTNIRRIGWVAAEVAKHGGTVVCAPIAPYDATRRWVRDQVERAAGPGSFVLVWVSTPLEVCEQRDVKGLYAQARSGALTGFTGIDDPYEPPADAELVIDTAVTPLADAVEDVMCRIADA